MISAILASDSMTSPTELTAPVQSSQVGSASFRATSSRAFSLIRTTASLGEGKLGILLADSKLGTHIIGVKEDRVHSQSNAFPVFSDGCVTLSLILSLGAQDGYQELGLFGDGVGRHEVALHGGAEGDAVLTGSISLDGRDKTSNSDGKEELHVENLGQ